MQYCKRCVLPDTRPGIVLDSEGICSACRSHQGKRRAVDRDARRAELEIVFEQAKQRRHGYDCIVPASGGKDSTWQVVKCLEFGLRVLAVTWRTPGRTAVGQANLDNMVRLGVDHIDYTINPEVERKFMYKALVRTGSTGVPMHMAVYAIPLQLAVKLEIPLVIWGENPHAEYGRTDDGEDSNRLGPGWGKRHGILQDTDPADWIDDDLTVKDMAPYLAPTEEAFDLSGVQSFFLGDYLEWDPAETLRVAQEHGFRVREQGPKVGLYDYADIDCDFISVHHHFKWLKFGFTRLFDNLALEIRNGRMARDEAIAEIRERGDQTPHEDIASLCAFLRISRDHFGQIEEKFRNRDVWEERHGAWQIPGFIVPDWNWT